MAFFGRATETHVAVSLNQDDDLHGEDFLRSPDSETRRHPQSVVYAFQDRPRLIRPQTNPASGRCLGYAEIELRFEQPRK